MTIEDIQERIYDIHDRLDIDEVYITSDQDDTGSTIVYTTEEQLRMYKVLVDRIHYMLMALYNGITRGELPPPIWIEVVDDLTDPGDHNDA